jgi:DNA-binding PadR family transcriptional regulator
LAIAPGDDLEEVPVSASHDVADPRDEVGWNLLVKEVAHRVDEYLSRTAPVYEEHIGRDLTDARKLPTHVEKSMALTHQLAAHSNVDEYNEIRYRSLMRRDLSQESRPTLPLPPAVFQILVALADQDRHGYAIMQDVAARTDGVKLSPGTLYGSIKRMLDEGLIVELDERPDPDHDDERRRYYRLTRFGREVAQAEADRLTTLLRQARAVGLTPRRSTS